MDPQSSFLADFHAFVTDLTTPERRNILALTEIARDSLQNYPAAAGSIAAVITNRILQAPVQHKLPVFYLLDSIAKNVGEPYKTYFAGNLADVFCNTWQLGGPGLQPPLEKLLNTWVGVFPQHVLNDMHARLAQLRTTMPLQPHAHGYGTAYGGGYAAAPAMQPAYQQPPQQPLPMVQDPRLASSSQYPTAAYPQHQQAPAYGMAQQPAYGAPAAAPMQQSYSAAPYMQQQQQQQPGYAYPAQQPAAYGQAPQQPMYAQAQPMAAQAAGPGPQQPTALPDLLSSLVSAGLLAGPAAPGLAQPQQPSSLPGTPPTAVTASPLPEQLPSLDFTPERLKESNPSAVARLLRMTEATKSRFLDRKFLRRQRQANLRESRLWYIDLDTWMASTTTAGGGQQQAQAQGGAAAGAAAALDPQQFSTPVDDAQTHCALSGERFEQFWDEEHQEWRYRGAKQLDAEEAAAYGLQEGALVLVSALGAPPTDVLQAGAGTDSRGLLSELKEEQQVAAELAAAAAEAAANGNGTAAAAFLQQPAADGKLASAAAAGAKHQRDDIAADGSEQQAPDEKRVKLEQES